MKNFVIILYLFFSLIQCSNNSNNYSKSTEIAESINNDTIVLDNISKFKANQNATIFTLNNEHLEYKPNNTFDLFIDKKHIGNIGFENKSSDIPGYSVWNYKSEKSNEYKIILIEAEADIGTAWYKIIILKEEQILTSFFIDEPRSNSEQYTMNQFITMMIHDNILTIKFTKRLIEKYSKIPGNLSSDEKYLYMDFSLEK